MSDSEKEWSLYAYEPNKVLPIVFGVLVGLSWVFHTYQNFRYNAWRVTFFMFYGGALFTAGWALRAISVHQTQNIGIFVASQVLIYLGPPVYAAAEYNILGQLMHYLPMHALLNPSRVIWVFVYLGIVVESLTGSGAARMADAPRDSSDYVVGRVLTAVALLLQANIEMLFTCIVALIHRRALRAGNCSPNVQKVCIMLYLTSGLLFVRCVARAVESLDQFTAECAPDQIHCGTLVNWEWFVYVFEAAPMVTYTYWLNIVHPARLLPIDRNHRQYLDFDGVTERWGPGWVDNRSKWKTFADPFDWAGKVPRDRFWERPGEWEPVRDGTFAIGTGSNVRRLKKSKEANAEQGDGKVELVSREGRPTS